MRGLGWTRGRECMIENGCSQNSCPNDFTRLTVNDARFHVPRTVCWVFANASSFHGQQPSEAFHEVFFSNSADDSQ